MERKKFYVVLDIITNILIVPVLLIALLCSILMYSAKKQNAVPSLFGYSAVKILTESMETDENPNFKVGNTVLVKKVNPETIQAGRTNGSVIAFYEYVYPGDTNLDMESINGGTQVGGNTNLSFNEYVGGGTNEAAKSGSRVLFHRVVDIKVASTADGEVHYFFSTQGDANASPDTFTDSNGEHTAYIRDDFVVGVYSPSSGFVTSLFSFCASPMGIVSLVVIPAGIVLIMVTASIIDQINMIVAQKKMDRRKLIEAEKMLQGEGSQLGPETPQAGEGELPAKAEPPVKPETPIKAPVAPKAETPKKAPVAPKPVPAKPEVPAKAPVAPQKAPAKAPEAPKTAPKPVPKAPAKAPAKPSAPAKAPAKAAPKAPAKPQKPE